MLELIAKILEMEEPLYIEKMEFDKDSGLHIYIDCTRDGMFNCSNCGKLCKVRDKVNKKWKHLKIFQYDCYIHFRNPRTNCSDCGKLHWKPPWTREGSKFTRLFEENIMNLAKEMPVSKIAVLVNEHDTRLWRIIKHYTSVAYAKKDFSHVVAVGCDETSSRKGHNYVTVFADMNSRDVIYVTKGKNAQTMERFADELPAHSADANQITELAIDMSTGFISGAAKHLPNSSITFDKFHVIKALNEAQDEVRRMEQRDNPLLKKSRYVWLKNPVNLTKSQIEQLEGLQTKNLKTAKVYQMKLVFQDIYRSIKDPETAEIAIKKWLSWAVRSRLEPIKKFAKMVKNHWDGIMRYFTSRLTTGAMEGINSRIQEIKRRARGFKNIDNFISMIYLEAANLDFDFCT
jgi:transposase